MIKKIQNRAAWLKGGEARCSVTPRHRKYPWRLVLLGVPGVGKGTQAELLSRQLGACHLSTGDVFRDAKCLAEGERSPALESALGQMKRGELVSDQTVLKMVDERVRCLRCCGGFILDGFPRTVAQAQALEQSLQLERIELDAVLDYELPIEEIVSRLGGRRSCPGCKAVFHVQYRQPRVDEICDDCGGVLVQREDDRPEAIRVRMTAYQENTRPLIDFYESRGLLIKIAADGAPEEICQRALIILDTAHQPEAIRPLVSK
jgi:adenylate kinase